MGEEDEKTDDEDDDEAATDVETNDQCASVSLTCTKLTTPPVTNGKRV